MTEAEWLACNDPQLMLEYLRGVASDRKLRLFAVACFRRVWHLLDDSRLAAIHTAERLAEGEVSSKERRAAFRVARFPAAVTLYADIWQAVQLARIHADLLAAQPAQTNAGEDFQEWSVGESGYAAQVETLCDIFGNPFSPVTPDPAWLTSTVTALARQMYDTRDFSAMPILADALQDAGCEDDQVLQHCRGPGPHARGCWVVDLVLGKG